MRMNGKNLKHGLSGLAAIALSIIACSLVSIPLPQIAFSDGQSPAADLIAYMGSDGNIYTVERSGASIQAWTDDAQPVPDADGAVRYYSDPSWAPGSKTLAFMEVETG